MSRLTSYSPTTWIEKVSRVGPTLLNKIEQAISAIYVSLLNLTSNVYNVMDYGALGDGVADDYAAIAAAYAAIPSTGGVLFFPAGVYKISAALSFTGSASKPVVVWGAGPGASVLAPSFASGDAVTIDSVGQVTVCDLSINPSVTRDQSVYSLVVSNANRVNVSDVTMQSTGGGLYKFDTCNFLLVTNCQGRTTNGVALRIVACNGSPRLSNSRFETSQNAVSGYTGYKPALYVTGTCTGLAFDNCTFTGAGPRSQWTVSSIASDAAKFTVTTSATHDFRVGDFVVLRGNTPSSYNNMWRVATVPSTTTFTVTSTLNPGASSVNGTAESVAACAYVSNEDAGSAFSVNESSFTGCLFEAAQTGLYGSAALYLDGRRGTYPTGSQSGSLSGWTLTGNYYDQYAIGLLLSGQASNSANETTLHGINVEGGVFNARGRCIHIDQVQGVTISGPVCCVPGSVTPILDKVSSSAGLYIYAGPSAPFTRGINVAGGLYGMGRNMQSTNNTPYDYGILLDSTGIDLLTITGVEAFGATAGIGEVNSPLAGTTRHLKIEGNSIAGGATFPPTDAELLPSIASAATIALTNLYQDTFKVTGTTNISTINVTWHGRRIRLIFTGALTLATGGNLALGVGKAVAAGEMHELVYDTATTAWYVG